MTRHLIAIDGIDGSGKSHLGQRLRERAGALLVKVDDFRRPLDWSRPDVDEDAAYYDDYYDFAGLQVVAETFADGAEGAEVATFDPVLEQRGDPRWLPLAGHVLLVIEGVFVRRIAATASATHIWLETSEAEARRRILARDTAKGRTPAEVERRIERRYFPSQRRYQDQFHPRERAQVVVAHETIGQLRVLRSDLHDVPAAVRAALAAALPDLA